MHIEHSRFRCFEKGMHALTARIAVRLLCVAIPLMLSGQGTLGPVTGHLSINKARIRSGESLEVRFEAVNRGREPIGVLTGDPETAVCGHFRVKIVGDGVDLQFPRLLNGGGSCLSGGKEIAPGHKYTESFWIGRGGELDRPGKYRLDVNYSLTYDKSSTFPGPTSPHKHFHKQFELTVEPAAHTGRKPG